VKVGAVFNVLDELREVLMDACPVLSAQRTVDEAAESGGDKNEQLKERCREWRAGNPKKGFQAMADELGISVDEAFKIGDELVDEEFDAKMPKPKAMPEAEKLAWESYLETGSIAEAAKASGVAVDTVKNWHKRRGWKGLRAAEKGI
jgi:hypothetical protein